MRTGASNAADSLQRGGDVGRAEIVRTGPRTAPARQKPMALGLVPVQTLLTVREAAELLRVRPVTVYRLCARGALPHFRVSNAIRIRAEDLERFLRGGGR